MWRVRCDWTERISQNQKRVKIYFNTAINRLIVKTEEKEKMLQLKNKLLFRMKILNKFFIEVEKPEKKDSAKTNPANYLNGMDIDSMLNPVTQNLNVYSENGSNQINSPLNSFVNKMI